MTQRLGIVTRIPDVRGDLPSAWGIRIPPAWMSRPRQDAAELEDVHVQQPTRPGVECEQLLRYIRDGLPTDAR